MQNNENNNKKRFSLEKCTDADIVINRVKHNPDGTVRYMSFYKNFSFKDQSKKQGLVTYVFNNKTKDIFKDIPNINVSPEDFVAFHVESIDLSVWNYSIISYEKSDGEKVTDIRRFATINNIKI